MTLQRHIKSLLTTVSLTMLVAFLTICAPTLSFADDFSYEDTVSPGYGTTLARCDINGDGVDDLISGTYWFSDQKVTVHLGPLSPSTAPITITPPDTYTMGSAVTCGHDLNGDGIDDLVLTHQGEFTAIVYGAEDFKDLNLATPGDRARIITSNQILRAESLGDINGDGQNDFAIVTDNKIYLFNGLPDAGELDPTKATTVITGTEATITRVTDAGDMNGDGKSDIFFGSPNASPTSEHAGKVWIVTNIDLTPNTTVKLSDGFTGFDINGPNGGKMLVGTSAARLGDINGDGFDDILIGAPSSDDNYKGAALIVLGSDQSNTVSVDPSATDSPSVKDSANKARGWWINSAAAGDHFGEAVGSIHSKGKVSHAFIGAIDGTLPGTPQDSGYALIIDTRYLVEHGDKAITMPITDMANKSERVTLLSGTEKEARLGRAMTGLALSDNSFVFAGGAPANFSQAGTIPRIMIRDIAITSKDTNTPNDPPNTNNDKTSTDKKKDGIANKPSKKSGSAAHKDSRLAWTGSNVYLLSILAGIAIVSGSGIYALKRRRHDNTDMT